LAGFQVIMYGRFWVITEDLGHGFVWKCGSEQEFDEVANWRGVSAICFPLRFEVQGLGLFAVNGFTA